MRQLFAVQAVRNQSQEIRPHYLSEPAAGFAQIIYVQLQFFDHLAHDSIAKGLNRLLNTVVMMYRVSGIVSGGR